MSKLLYTLWYTRKIQLIYRLRLTIHRIFHTLCPELVNKYYDSKANKNLKVNIFEFFLPKYPPKEIQKHNWVANELFNDKLTFINKTLQFHKPFDWHKSELNVGTRLWKLNLNYMDYIYSLAYVCRSENFEKKYIDKFVSIISDWIDKNYPGLTDYYKDCWNSYAISIRLVNWILSYRIIGNHLPDDFRDKFLNSLYKQALFLENYLEYDILGNHLIKNVKALLFLGTFVRSSDADRWLNLGLKNLESQLEEQILDDGAHLELSPMYHCIVLEDLLDIYNLVKHNSLKYCQDYISINGGYFQKLLQSKINWMLHWLANIVDDNGRIPLLNDSAYKIAPEFTDLCEYAEQLGFPQPKISTDRNQASFALDSSGYYVMRDKSREKYLIVDCGKIGPDYLPPHAHADTLNYELSLGNERIIVDSGIYEYTSGKWRDFYRSTRAHNTVVVDGLNQSDVWGSFRAGHRAFPTEVKWIVKDDITFFEGGHDGYLKQVGILHKRKIVFVDNDFWLIFDELDGIGMHIVEEYLHFHPEIEVTCENAIIAQKSKRHILQIMPLGKPETQILQGELEPIQGWYSPEFGKKEPNPVLLLRYEASLPVRIGYGLFPMPVEYFSIDSSFEEGQLKLKLNGISYRIELADNDITLQKEGNT